MANKYTGLGFTLKMNSTAIAGLRDISKGEASGEAVDVTSYDDLSTSDRFLRKKGGLVDPGAVTLDLVYDPDDDSHQALAAALASGTTQGFEIIYPTTTKKDSFTAIVNGLGQEIPFGQRVSASVRLDISGVPHTWTS